MTHLRSRLNAAMLLAALVVSFVPQARADSENVEQDSTAAPKTVPTPSSNLGKTGRFLPGEEVVGATGKTVKVWSTEGPVPVSRPPEPFEDTVEQKLPADTHVVIDEEELRRHRDAEAQAPGGSPPHQPPVLRHPPAGDSFEVGPR